MGPVACESNEQVSLHGRRLDDLPQSRLLWSSRVVLTIFASLRSTIAMFHGMLADAIAPPERDVSAEGLHGSSRTAKLLLYCGRW
jgi:hypothetical protein